MVELSKGDFLYQSDQELFLVVLGETEDSYQFAAHGWREIGKERVEHYVEDDRSKVHRQAEIEQLVSEEASDDEAEQYEKLKQLFDAYEDLSVDDDGPQSEFALKE